MDFKNIAILKTYCQIIGLKTFGDLQKFILKHGENNEHLLYTFARYVEGV